MRLLARELAREPDVAQRLVTQRGSELARRAAADGISVCETAWTAGLDLRAWWRVVREVHVFSPHLLHAHDAHAVSLAVGARALAPWFSARAHTPVIATRRVVFPVRRRSALFRAQHVLAISGAVRAALIASGVPSARITLVPSGIDPDEVRRLARAAPPLAIRAALGLAPDTVLAANVAALEPAKDHLSLLRAARAARPLHPELHWVIAGDGRLRATLEAERDRLDLADRVHLVGQIDRPEALIGEASVFVMSSRAEGLGTAVLQARALGIPVVATRGGGLAEIVPEDCLVPVGDADGLARAVVRALAHPAPVPLPVQFTARAMSRGVLAAYRSLV